MRYKMDDGRVVDTDRAADCWAEATWWDGRNHISTPTGSQEDHETLYLSSKGSYYLHRWSQRQGACSWASWASESAAATWLAQNGHEIPEDLVSAAAEILE